MDAAAPPPHFDPTLSISHPSPTNSCLSPPHVLFSARFPPPPSSSPIMPRPPPPAPHHLLLSSLTSRPLTQHHLPIDFPSPSSSSLSGCPPPVPKRRRTTAPLLPHPSPPPTTLSTARPRRKPRSRSSAGLQSSQKASLNGLKTFTMSVVAKLKQYATSSSYTAVADELVRDAFSRLRSDGKEFSEPEVDKNIRRRVYDALNVLASMGFVARSGKDVEWKGIAGFMRHVGLRIPNIIDSCLPGACFCNTTASASSRTHGQITSYTGQKRYIAAARMCGMNCLEGQREEKENIRKRIAEKRARVSELRSQEAYLQQIVTRNASRDSARVTTGFDVLVSDNLEYVRPDPNRVDLPFVMISTAPGTSVALEMEENKEEVVFRFDGPFKIHEGYSIVGQVCEQEERHRKLATVAMKEGNTMRSDSWPELYDGQSTSPVTDLASASTCETLKFLEATPTIATVMKRRTPPCFALYRPDFLR